MGTGVIFANITNKKILGFEDLSDRFLEYLRNLNIESVQSRFDLDGVFNAKLTLSGSANNTVKVNGSSKATDGLGHIFNPANIYPDATALFENTSAIVYQVGFKFIEVATGIDINPRTGEPEYTGFEEMIGEQEQPNSVTDNGGTITFNVNDICESGVSHAGRTVRVYMKTPAAGALSASIAFEDLTVSYSAPNNTITTTGTLGQSTVSTDVEDYWVVLLGTTVKRNFDVENSPAHFFVGTVTGSGTGTTPSVFNITNQRLLKTFEDATQVIFTPYSWITATDVQNALQQVVDILADAGTVNPGATRIGTNPTVWDSQAPSLGTGGYGTGNVADGTFNPNKDLQSVLNEVNNVLAKRHAWTATMADGTVRDQADFVGANSIDQLTNLFASGGLGSYWLQGGNHDLSTLTSIDSGAYPHIVGEDGQTGADAQNYTRVRAPSSPTSNFLLRGHWERVSFETLDLAQVFEGRKGLRMTDVMAIPGHLRFNTSVDSASAHQGVIVNGLFVEGTISVGADGLEVTSDADGSAEKAIGTFNNLYVKVSNGHALNLHDIGANVGTSPGNATKVVFRDCVFWSTSSSHSALVASAADAVFENCLFIGIGNTTWVADITSRTTVFRNCVFVASEGQALDADSGVFENCLVRSGDGTANTNPRILRMVGNIGVTTVRNMIVEIGLTRGAAADAPTNILIELGGSNGAVDVDGLYIESDTTKLHKSRTLHLKGTTSSAAARNKYRNVTVNFVGYDFAEDMSGLSDPIRFEGSTTKPIIENFALKIGNVPVPDGDGTATNLVEVSNAEVHGFFFVAPTGGTGTSNWLSLLNIGFGSDVFNARFDVSSVDTLATAAVQFDSSDSSLRGFDFDGPTLFSVGMISTISNANDNTIEDLTFNNNVVVQTLLNNVGLRNNLRGMRYNDSTIWGTSRMLNSTGSDFTILDCKVAVTSGSDTWNLTGGNSIVSLCRLAASSGGFALTNSGGSSISPNNIIT